MYLSVVSGTNFACNTWFKGRSKRLSHVHWCSQFAWFASRSSCTKGIWVAQITLAKNYFSDLCDKYNTRRVSFNCISQATFHVEKYFKLIQSKKEYSPFNWPNTPENHRKLCKVENKCKVKPDFRNCNSFECCFQLLILDRGYEG